jgi:Tfp pilus assembly protein PilE
MKLNIKNRAVSAFTIVELLIVITVIAILATVTIVAYNGIQDNAHKTTLMSDLDNAVSILELSLKQNGSYPASTSVADNGNPLPASTGTTYQYKVDNTTPTKIFCLTATNGSLSYNINQEGTPSAGICPILYLDAGIGTSYPGSGTVATDLSGYGHNGTLLNGVGYSNANGGSWVFDGTNDVISLGTGNTFFTLPNFSMELWFKSDGTTPVTGTDPGLLGITYGIRLMVYSTYLTFALDDGTAGPGMNTAPPSSFYNSSWHQVVIQANSTTRYIYVDGVLSNTLNAGWPGITRWPTNGAYIGRDNNNSMYFFTGNISSVRFYDKVLSAPEVKQHFDALRGRYGI